MSDTISLDLVPEATHLDIYINSYNAIDYDDENLELKELEITKITASNINQISLFDKQWITQNIDIIDSVINDLTTENIKAYYVDRTLFTNIQYGFKALLPPKTVKVNFIKYVTTEDEDGNTTSQKQLLYQILYYTDEGNYVINDDNYNHWFLLRVEELATTDKENNVKFEYLLHNYDTEAHKLNIYSQNTDLVQGGILSDNSVFSTYTIPKTNDGKIQSCIIKGNVISANYNLYYLGNSITPFEDLGGYLNPAWNTTDKCICTPIYQNKWNLDSSIHSAFYSVFFTKDTKKSIIIRDSTTQTDTEYFFGLASIIGNNNLSLSGSAGTIDLSLTMINDVNNYSYTMSCINVTTLDTIPFFYVKEYVDEYQTASIDNFTWSVGTDIDTLQISTIWYFRINPNTQKFPTVTMSDTTKTYTFNQKEIVGNQVCFYSSAFDTAYGSSGSHAGWFQSASSYSSYTFVKPTSISTIDATKISITLPL